MATLLNATTPATGLPPLPDYTLRDIAPLVSFVSDFWLSLLLPPVGYWLLSGIFHLVDTYDLLPQYRLHTPAEITQRNLAGRWEVARDVVLQQVLQVAVGALLSMTEPGQLVGSEGYDVAEWATRVRLAQRALPRLLALLGLNAAAISKSMAASHPVLAAALAGGHYPFLTTQLDGDAAARVVLPAFAAWELLVAQLVYYLIVPGLQMFVAVVFLDTWQYFWHRGMHMNKWMYTVLHSRHHRLYVPYAYGALYNHPVEGFVLDTSGAALAYKVAGLTPRMGMAFFLFSSLKTVDDHCGYALPWDPLQHLSGNNAAYHDVHHQSWGIKTNFSQPFFTFWDRVLGTMWKGDTRLRYERARATAADKEARSNGRSKAQ